MKLNIHEAKTHLSQYLAQLEPGEVITLCKNNVPIAEIHPFSPRPSGKRPLGQDKEKIEIPKEFFEPLPDELLRAFGEDDS